MTSENDLKRMRMDADSVREMGRNLGKQPMEHLNDMTRVVAGLNVHARHYGLFGFFGSSLEDALDQVKLAAHQYVAATRHELAEMESKAFDTANTAVQGDGAASGVMAG
ncbi:hypothetical protein [Nonomuraea guangzhouensis]|uniref:ESX-1 secretion-associated protein n=1 Tax=Nonomuraea guangzhouensis TaxID=1291555 RepID=A0ABW4GDL7_9ACTN|nr:hypothetical protein [Nonomuraea guangzhouensis]